MSSLTENSFQKDKLLKDALDQLYKETMIRLEIEKKIRILESEVLKLKADDRKIYVNQADGKNESQGMILKNDKAGDVICVLSYCNSFMQHFMT